MEEQKHKRLFKNEDSLRTLWNIKHSNTHTGPRSQREKVLLQLPENFPNLTKETDIQVQEAQEVPNKIKLKKLTLRHIIIICYSQDKESILKDALCYV